MDDMTENSMITHTPFVTKIYTLNMEEVDVEPILDGVADLMVDNPSAQISNRGGWQSPPYVGSNTQYLPFMDELNRKIPFIANEIAKQYNITLNPKWSYWFNVNYKDNYNVAHNHPATAFSAVFYVNVPEDGGKIVFDRPDPLNISIFPKEHNENTWEHWFIEPVNKDLVIFPGYLKHSVEPNNNMEERISIAYNFTEDRSYHD